jgi:hypothetical protein
MFFFSIPSIEKSLRIRFHVVAYIFKGLVATREDGSIGTVGAPGNAGRGFRRRGGRGGKCHSFSRDQNKQENDDDDEERKKNDGNDLGGARIRQHVSFFLFYVKIKFLSVSGFKSIIYFV